MRRVNYFFIFFITFFYSVSTFAEDDLVFGSVAMDIPAVMHKRLKPLTKYLGKN